MNVKRYQSIQCNSVYHHTKFERNLSVNVQTQANINCFKFMKSRKLSSLPRLLIRQDKKKKSKGFVTSTSFSSIPVVFK